MKYRSLSHILLFAGSAACYGASAPALYATADAIVLGTVSSVNPTLPDLAFPIDVEMPIKGDVQPRSLVTVRCPSPYSQAREGQIAQEQLRGIWFLKRESGGTFRCIVPVGGEPAPIFSLFFHVGMPEALPPALQLTPADSTAETIIKLVGSALDQGIGSAEMFLSAAYGFDTPTVRALLRYFAQAQDAMKRAAGIGGLIERQDLAVLADYLESHKDFTVAQTNVIARRISYLGQDRGLLEALGAAAIDPSSPESLRNAAAYALRSVHTRETLPFLATLLDSSDLLMQVHAVFGLSAFVHGWAVVTPESTRTGAYQSDTNATSLATSETNRHAVLRVNADAGTRAEVISFWKNWWSAHQAEVTGPQ